MLKQENFNQLINLIESKSDLDRSLVGTTINSLCFGEDQPSYEQFIILLKKAMDIPNNVMFPALDQRIEMFLSGYNPEEINNLIEDRELS